MLMHEAHIVLNGLAQRDEAGAKSTEYTRTAFTEQKRLFPLEQWTGRSLM